jgi:hypothetical protein
VLAVNCPVQRVSFLAIYDRITTASSDKFFVQ